MNQTSSDELLREFAPQLEHTGPKGKIWIGFLQKKNKRYIGISKIMILSNSGHNSGIRTVNKMCIY